MTGHAKANLRADANLVLVPVTVCDPLNRPVTGLEKEHFRVLEDKVEQKITQFAMDDDPVAVGLVFDTSGSMGSKLQRSRMAAVCARAGARPRSRLTTASRSSPTSRTRARALSWSRTPTLGASFRAA